MNGGSGSGVDTARGGVPGSRPWWRLGDRRAPVPSETGAKAGLLHRAARAGRQVPEAVVVPEESLRAASERGLVAFEGEGGSGAARVVEPAGLTAWLGLPGFSGPVAVRSAFSTEDGVRSSQAGRYTSRLWVDPLDPDALCAALEACWRSAASASKAAPRRRDVLIMRMVHARRAGVAFTEPEHEDDLVNACEGTAESLVGGQQAGESLELAKLRRGERPKGPGFADLAPWASRLARLLRDVRARFGPGPWDVEWADDGETCWLVQMRPVTRPTRRNELFTVANHREILPDPPSPLMTGVIAEAAPELYEYYRRFDPRLPRNRPFIEVIHGRPLINLSLLLDTMRAWGLPTRLVTDSIGTRGDQEMGLDLPRAARAMPALIRARIDQWRAPARAERVGRELARRAAQTPHGIAAQLDALREVYARFVQEMFALTAAMSAPLSVARRLGVLETLGARAGTVTSELADALEELRRIASEEKGAGEALARGELPTSERFRRAWDDFLNRFGHRGIYESDIARPRYADDPSALLAALSRGAARVPKASPRRSARAALLGPLFAGAARATRAREALRHETMRAFLSIRRRMLELAEDQVRRGALPERDALFELEPDEARRLERGAAIYGSRDIAERRARQRERAARPLPDVLRRFDPLPDLVRAESRGALQGIGLVRGVVEGRAWVMSVPDDPLPDPEGPGHEPAGPSGLVLVAPAVDPGWVPLFGMFDAVAVQTGGDLSHASIVLREKGIVSVTNVSGLMTAVRTGQRLRVDGASGGVEVLGVRGHDVRPSAEGDAHAAPLALKRSVR